LNKQSSVSSESIECPLCLGAGRLKRSEVLDRLGVKDFARVAQLSAEEAFRLLQHKQDHDRESAWARFEGELTKRTAEIRERHKDELHSAQSERNDLARRVEGFMREVSELREKNHQLETEMAKVARVGRREEMDFADEARTWAGICVSDKLPNNGDFLLAFRDLGGAPIDPQILVDCKDKAAISQTDLDKLVRDAKERSIQIAAVVAHEESQLRQVDKETRWGRKDGVWILRTTRQWFPRDLNLLKPLLEKMRVQGSDFLDKNAALGEEVRRTFANLDRIEGELKKASKAIISASGLVTKYRGRLQELCDNATAEKIPSERQLDSRLARAGD